MQGKTVLELTAEQLKRHIGVSNGPLPAGVQLVGLVAGERVPIDGIRFVLPAPAAEAGEAGEAQA
jgi:hypothetical protein